MSKAQINSAPASASASRSTQNNANANIPYVRPDFTAVKNVSMPENGLGFSNVRTNMEELIDPMAKYNSNGFSVAEYENERHCNFLFADKFGDDKLIDEKEVSPDYIYWDIIKNFQERSPLMDNFFSRRNLDHIQNILIQLVENYSQGAYHISRQNDQIVLKIMRDVYLGSPINALVRTMPELRHEVAVLNKNTIDAIFQDTIVGIQQYLGYARDQGNNPYTMDQPQNVSDIGTKLTRGFDFNII